MAHQIWQRIAQSPLHEFHTKIKRKMASQSLTRTIQKEPTVSFGNDSMNTMSESNDITSGAADAVAFHGGVEGANHPQWPQCNQLAYNSTKLRDSFHMHARRPQRRPQQHSGSYFSLESPLTVTLVTHANHTRVRSYSVAFRFSNILLW